jgi:predicted aspartyl protease
MSKRIGLQALFFAVAVTATTLGFGENVKKHPGGTPVLKFAGQSQELRMINSGDRAVVEARIGDSGPYKFLIDTGASLSVVDTGIAATLGLDVIGELEVGAPGGRQVASNQVLIPKLSVDGLVIENLRPVVVGIEEMSMGMIQGVLGMDVFQSALLTLNPVHGVATVSHGALAADSPGVIEFDNSQGRMMFEIEVEGRQVPMQIDTGSPGGFTLPASMEELIPIDRKSKRSRTARLVGGERIINTFRLKGSLAFAGTRYENPDVSFMHPSPPTGNIGNAVIGNMIISAQQEIVLSTCRGSQQGCRCHQTSRKCSWTTATWYPVWWWAWPVVGRCRQCRFRVPRRTGWFPGR